MATTSNTTHAEKPSRRALLTSAATMAAAAAAPAIAAAPSGIGIPAIASPEITGAVAAYWARVAECNAPGTSDETVDAKCEEIEDAATRLAEAPCRSLADMAAKVVFFVAVAKETRALQYMTEAEGDVLLSVEAHMLALAGGAA